MRPGTPAAHVSTRCAAPPRWLGTPVLLGGIAGIAVQLQQAALWNWRWYAVLGGCALGWLSWILGAPAARRGGQGWRAAAAAAAAGALLWAVCGLRAMAFLSGALDPALEGVDLRVTGVVASMPQPREGGWRLRLAVESAQREGRAVALPPLVDLSWHAGGWGGGGPPAPALRAGERWRLTVRLNAPHGARNPHGFDYELWLWEQGVQATGQVRTGARAAARHGAAERLGQTRQYPVEQWRQQVRDTILARLAPTGASERRQRAAGVVAALVTGDQRAIDRADWDVFRATGVAHLMSISGLHITLFAWLASGALGRLWRLSARLPLWVPAPTAALVGGVLLAAAYALFSGWGVPAQRTICMLATVALLRLSGRQWPWPQVWLLACAVVLAIDPWAMLQAGFWLSFVAVAVLFASDHGRAHGPQGLLGRGLAMLREQGVVTVALAPLTLLLFGQVSVIGLVANLLAIPWATLVVLPPALLGVLWPPLWKLAAWGVEWLGVWLQWLAAWPLAQLNLPLAPFWAGAAAVAGGVVLVLRLPLALRLLGLPLVLPALWWQPPRPPPGHYELLALDVGQGQAVLVRTARHSLLYDAGPRFSATNDAGERVVVPLLQALGERLDRVVLSHGDLDHVGGAPAVLRQQPRAEVLGSIAADHPLQALRPVTACVAGQRWQWDGVSFEVLHPFAGAPPTRGSAARPNARSCVLRIQAGGPEGQGGATALLAGDIERAQEAALVAAGAPLAADVLLVPHHGSKTSSTDAFLDAVHPALALAQAGYRNRFGHPAPVVVQRYEERGIRLVASPACGAALWRSVDARLHCERTAAMRYWHHRLPEP